jgi:GT2 family glycosyltransferase
VLKALFKSLFSRRKELLEQALRSAESADDLRGVVEVRRAFAKLEPRSADAWFALAKALQKAGEPREAVTACRKALDCGIPAREVHLQLGMAHAQLSEHERAIAHLERAIELAPQDADAVRMLRTVMSDLERFDQAARPMGLSGATRSRGCNTPRLTSTSENMKKILIVIPFYKNRDQLNRCIDALRSQTVAEQIEIFVRDNTKDNILFTAAVNEGIEKYICDPEIEYIVVLNQDAYLRPNAIEQMKLFMEKHRKCGIAAPIQVLFQKPDRVIWGGSLEAFPYGAHVTGKIEDFKKDVEVPWASGCCMMLRAKMVREVGLLDKNMRFICSDSDYCFTARARGWEIFMTPLAVVEHEAGGSSKVSTGSLLLDRVKLEDVAFFARKWLTGGLYRSLATEGKALDPIGVQAFLSEVENQINHLG